MIESDCMFVFNPIQENKTEYEITIFRDDEMSEEPILKVEMNKI